MKQFEPYWETNEVEDTHFFRIKKLLIAVVQPADTDGKYCIYAYDSDWQDLYMEQYKTDMPEFDTLELAKSAAEGTFVGWMLAIQQEFDL